MSISISLAATIEVAIDRADRHNRSVLLTYSVPWQCRDLLAFLADQPGKHHFYWQRGVEQLCAADRLLTCIVQGKERFLQLGLQIHGYLENYVAGGSFLVAPYFLGGFSFDEHRDSVFWLPAWLVHQRGEVGTLTLFYVVQPQHLLRKIQVILEEYLSELTRFRSPSPTWAQATYRSRIAVTKADRHQWETVVDRALTYIREDKLQKVVLARVIEVTGDRDFSPFAALGQLRIDHPDCILFLMCLAENKAFLGATPEMLLEFYWQADRLILHSDAVAGSAPRGENPSEDKDLGNFLLESRKDNQEHKMVVQSIEQGYSAIGATVQTPSLPKLLKLHNIQHLYTPITAQWLTDRWERVFAVLAALHPTSAVGGEPRNQALQFIQESEPFDREGYAAPLGWVNGSGAGAFAVAIRSGYLEGSRARIFAGSGIIADSHHEREWEETTLKLQALLKVLGVVTD